MSGRSMWIESAAEALLCRHDAGDTGLNDWGWFWDQLRAALASPASGGGCERCGGTGDLYGTNPGIGYCPACAGGRGTAGGRGA